MALRLFSPAKLNLFLRILNRRPDGYHNLVSLYQSIDFGDYLTISFSDDDIFECSNSEVPKGNSNLIFRAINLFRDKTGLNAKFKVNLDKKIPMQAGLGGGSSNAATALFAVNEMHGNPVDTSTLMEWSAEVGSDVPFFFSLGSAYCTGRGDKVLPFDELTPLSLTLIKPKESLSTPEVYGKVSPDKLSSIEPEKLLESWQSGEPIFCNDLETAAFEIIPELLLLKQKLIESGFQTMMTGSGTTFFCIGDGELPDLKEVDVFQTRFIKRKENFWYEL